MLGAREVEDDVLAWLGLWARDCLGFVIIKNGILMLKK